jgi:hypothetical protein
MGTLLRLKVVRHTFQKLLASDLSSLVMIISSLSDLIRISASLIKLMNLHFQKILMHHGRWVFNVLEPSALMADGVF